VDLLLHLTDGKTSVNPGSVGGVIFADVISNRAHVENFIEMGLPVVLMNYLDEDLSAASISIDNLKGACTATQYLIQMGHEKIAFISGDLLSQAARDRQEGYKKSMSQAGLSVPEAYCQRGDYSRKSARVAAERLLALSVRPTAVFVSSDDMAMEAISVFQENDLKVPEDISVIGFDDDPVCLYGPVSLTTMRQPLREMAQAAVKELYLKIREPEREVNRIVLSPDLVIRDSVVPFSKNT
jgi:DNA-binding LacI/PurR family transcriptional regulator